jgi:hypothetical protein
MSVARATWPAGSRRAEPASAVSRARDARVVLSAGGRR